MPVRGDVQPNKYLHGPMRDLVVDDEITLTKINPAYMTRQIAEIAARETDGVQFHITSLMPIRPENEATEWEKEWLGNFEQGVPEQWTFMVVDGQSSFRYMAPLKTEKACLQCHEKQGYKEGDVCGGISVTLPYFSQDFGGWLIAGYVAAATFGVLRLQRQQRELHNQQLDMVRANITLEKEILERKQAYKQLKEANEEVQSLEGILPICMHCKEIRDDKGYWTKLENYIQSRSDAKFSHSICDECLDKRYPEEDGNQL